MSLLGLSSNYRKAAKQGMSVLAMNERDREMTEEQLKQQEKGQQMSMTTTGAGMGAMMGMGAVKAATAGMTGMGGAMAGLTAIAPWLVAGAGVGYLLSRIF